MYLKKDNNLLDEKGKENVRAEFRQLVKPQHNWEPSKLPNKSGVTFDSKFSFDPFSEQS